ncbi:MAG: beta-lactamase family protein [Bifidobacteriaceae bacterium]|jgi:CubicO group peptidase (beta-lactamase class C family)|nr:beta-lactamase family protein [Bifidobacteriaceae bacterium]
MSYETLTVPLADQLDALFGQYTAAGQARGLVYGLSTAGGLVHWRGFGQANDAGAAPDADTVFPIASMTKSFVAAGALAARDRGLIDLDAPITDFFGEFAALGPNDEPMDPPTIKELLTMGGGLTEDNSWVDPFIDMSVEDLLGIIAPGLRYSHPPGAAFEYSNLGFALAGLAVGRAVGRPIEDWVREEIVDPLALGSTRFDNQPPDPNATRAVGYTLSEAGEWIGYPPVVSAAFAAAGGMVSTVRDLTAWITWLGAAWRDGLEEGPLRRASRRELQRVHQLASPAASLRLDGALELSVSGYGIGLMVREDLHRGTVVAHSGGLPGFITYMVWHPDSGRGVVVATNSHRSDPRVLGDEALRRALAADQAPARSVRLWPATRERLADAETLIRAWDEDLAARVLADNIGFDRPLAARRAAIAELITQIGPLRERVAEPDVLSATTPADVSWSIPGERGELICSIHLTPTRAAQIQEWEVAAAPWTSPRTVRPVDVSRKARRGTPTITSEANRRIIWPPPGGVS